MSSGRLSGEQKYCKKAARSERLAADAGYRLPKAASDSRTSQDKFAARFQDHSVWPAGGNTLSCPEVLRNTVPRGARAC